MQQPTAHVPAPEMTVDTDGTARSVSFDDVYFSARGGVAETEHVFIAGNGLPERWQGRSDFTIGELGFGTGLNFLVAWKRFVETNATGTLHFLSVEKFPLTIGQLREALAHQPELKEYADQLIANYPLRLPGWHRVQFDRVQLTLGFGDAVALLPEMEASVDAWFLDGFAPAKNETMWSHVVLQYLAKLSTKDASFATFTAAGIVKRRMQELGFEVRKVQGFAHKRDMLVGQRSGTREEKTKPKTALVIGGGIAGCSAARALAERGIRVTLHEKHTIASGASGNPAAVLYPQLTKYFTPATAWHFTAYDFALRALQRWGVALQRTGMLKIGKDNTDDEKLRGIRETLQLDASVAEWLEPEQASARVGRPLARGGFYLPHGAWVRPIDACRALLDHANITVREHSEVTELPTNETVVIANAHAANALLPAPVAFGLTAGQVSVLQRATKLSAVLCHKGYAIDSGDALIIGATYDRNDLSGTVTSANHAQNMAELRDAISIGELQVVSGRTSVRASTPSRIPQVGQASANVYVSVGHGSRGMISAPLAAEVIASMICGEPLPVMRGLCAKLVPHRS